MAETADYSDYKILLVDDETPILSALRRTFFDESWETYTASSGDEAISLIYDHEFAVVLSDYKMPDMNGVELLTEVRKISPDTVRMIISGYAEAHAIVEAINEGQIFRFIPKPWNNTELLNIVKQGIRFYSLTNRNRELEARLLAKNAELAAINEDLELRVKERTRELSAHNQALTFVQEVLDELPYAILGIDPEGLIVMVNKLGFQTFASSEMVLGSDVEFVLGQELTAMAFKVINDPVESLAAKVSINGNFFESEIIPMRRDENTLRGLALVLRKL
ncbi:response regulator [Myxococcota bacterium]|nr:response regulator [Myxococcota bacterium]MBU1381557.1 response regulator [Myxococcota bacterium]MBU1495441.1 response regulator [Myxococcota bacterium]